MVTASALQRTFRFNYGSANGTCFTIDIDSRQYLVTARHLVQGAEGKIVVQLYHDGQWKDLACEVVGLATGDPDIAVLAPPFQISPSHSLEPMTPGDIYLSQDAFFLGFPYGLHCEVGGDINSQFPIPLVKKACISLMHLVGPNKYLLLDGHNNPGFSGGPVVYSPVGKGLSEIRVAGVVSGYRYEWDKVYMGDQETQLSLRYNTGIIIAYSIHHAVEIIKKKPTGALVNQSGTQ
jgi:hypothetical protein